MPIPAFPFCDDVHALVPEILADWDAHAAKGEWGRLPPVERETALPDLVARLLTTALCRPDDGPLFRETLAAAADHGVARRGQDFPQALLLTEYHMLREAMWRVLLRHVPNDATRAIFRIDRAISAATRATYIGYYRDGYEEAGRWPAALDQVASDPLYGASPFAPGP
jgi:hypothetical protein